MSRPLRIFLALASSPNQQLASNIWSWNLHDPLVELGHDVVLWDGGIQPLFDVAAMSEEGIRRRAEFDARFLAAVRAANAAGRLDLVLTYVSDSHLEPDTIRRVSTEIAPIVNFFCNNEHQFHLVQRTAAAFDLVLVPEAAAIRKYERAGGRPRFFPMAANPTHYHPIDTPLAWDVTFGGQRYADRGSLVLALLEAGVSTHAFGPSWIADSAGAGGVHASGPLRRSLALLAQGKSPLRAARDVRDWNRLRAAHPDHLHGPVSDAEYVRLYSASRISLGFLIVGDTHRSLRPQRQVRLREFEGPMCGAFYLTGWMDELALHYEIGREIVCYRSAAELVDLARYYLAHDEARDRVRRAGHARALRDHTWHRRFETLFADLTRTGVLREAAVGFSAASAAPPVPPAPPAPVRGPAGPAA